MPRATRLLAAVTALIAFIPLTGGTPAAAAAPAAAAPSTAAPATVNPALAVPTQLVAGNDSRSIWLSWRQPRDGARAESFRVYEGSTVVARTTTTAAYLTNLGFGSQHTYTVTAVDSRGRESAHTAPIHRTVWVGGQPPNCFPPQLPVLAATEVTPSAIALSWSPVLGPRPFQLRVESPALATPLTLPMEGTGVRIGGLAPDTAYAFRVVTASCNGQTLPPLTSLTVTTPAGSALRPQAPVDASVAAVTDDSATLRWSAPAGGERPVRYAVYEGATLIARASSTSVTVRRLFHAQRYAFTVASIDAAGNESAHSPLIAVNTAVCPSPKPKPTALRAEALSPSTVRLSWVQISEAVSFTVYDGSTPVATTTAPAAVISGLPSNSGHSYRVVATLVNGCGDTARSAGVSVRTPAGATARPAAPTSVYARVATQNWNTDAVVAVTWSRPPATEPALTYRVYEDATVVATSTAASAEITVLTNTSHTYTVTAVDAAGNESVASRPTTVQVPYFPLP